MDNQDQLDDDDDFVRAMEEGIAEADRGEFISNEEVLRWLQDREAKAASNELASAALSRRCRDSAGRSGNL